LCSGIDKVTALYIDGKGVAAQLRKDIAHEVAILAKQGVTPGLAVILVGDDPASHIYVRSKGKQTLEAGMLSFEYRLPNDVSHNDLLALVGTLNVDDAVDGILVQLPLPPHINADQILRSIDPSKDVDGFHPVNVGLVAIDSGGIVPCTPLGSLLLLKSVLKDLSGLNALVVGRSNIVGKPMVQLLLKENCTVTIAHSKSRDLPAIVRAADIVIAAVGKPEMIRGDWIKPGAIVIDVGINRISVGDGKTKIVGDVAFDEAALHAIAITPVPGGVGPMTIACLLRNTLNAARARRRADGTQPSNALI
jgi:methylenetetrahydrofolate dehydrogenase (NADP+) / methenyltetrahydrofolate cyclohydrolase